MLFPLRDHNEYDNKIDCCLAVVRSRRWRGISLTELLNDEKLIENFSKELIFLCFKAAELL